MPTKQQADVYLFLFEWLGLYVGKGKTKSENWVFLNYDIIFLVWWKESYICWFHYSVLVYYSNADVKHFCKSGAEIGQKWLFLLLQIVWDPVKKRWIDVGEDDSKGNGDLPPPPPKTSELPTMTSVSTSGSEGPTARSSSPNVFRMYGRGKGKKKKKNISLFQQFKGQKNRFLLCLFVQCTCLYNVTTYLIFLSIDKKLCKSWGKFKLHRMQRLKQICIFKSALNLSAQ